MKTILYNTVTQQVIHHANHGSYAVDGLPAILSSPWVQLNYIEEPVPTYDAETHIAEKQKFTADVENNIYCDSWLVRPLTQTELNKRAWAYAEYSMKLIVDESVLFTPEGNQYKVWLDLKGYPIEMVDGKINVWVDSIHPDHQAYATLLETNNLLTIENAPV